MKAAVFSEVGRPLEIQEVPKPSAGPGELVIKVAACGICGSDLHAASTPGVLSHGVVLGHEYTGIVEDVGPGGSDHWQPGDRVTAMAFRFCGRCAACGRGEYALCEGLVPQGFDPRFQGAFAEYATCFEPLTVKIPDSLSLTDGALVEPLSVGLSAWRTGGVPMAGSVLIIGGGPIGLSIAKWARFFGARDIVVSEPVAVRRERALEAGATLVVDPAGGDNPAAVMERSTGRRPAVIFECVGKPIFNELIGMCPPNAHLVMCGTCMEPDSFVTVQTAYKSPRVSFVLGYGMDDFSLTIEMMARGRMTADPLHTASIGLEELPGMFETLKQPNDQAKVVVAL